MDTINHLELISKLRQRLIRLIKLGEPNQLHSTTPTIDLTTNIEECIRRLFNNSCTVEIFIQEVQRILNVTIKSSLSLFLIETIPLAHQYLQQHQYDPLSWETFKTIPLQTSSITTRLPSLQQAHFRLPSSYPQLIDLTSSLSTHIIPNIRPNADLYQQKLIHRYAQHNFYLNQDSEDLFLQTLYNFLRHVIQRLHFYAKHRIDIQFLNSNNYEMTSNVREQIRYLIELNKFRTNELNNLHINSFQYKIDNEQKHEYRSSVIEESRQKEANETACLVLRESRSKRQKLIDDNNNNQTFRFIRANLQHLIVVMENIPLLRRSKTLLYAYANR